MTDCFKLPRRDSDLAMAWENVFASRGHAKPYQESPFFMMFVEELRAIKKKRSRIRAFKKTKKKKNNQKALAIARRRTGTE